MGNAISRLRYPLSPSQARNFLEDAVAEADRGLNIEQVVCSTSEDLNLPVFRESWQAIAKRHPAVCVKFGRDDQQRPYQEISTPVDLPILEEDRHHLKASERDAYLETWLQQDRQAGFDLSHPPLMRVTVIHFADNLITWVWTFHQILMDERSLRLVLEDFFACYESSCAGRPVVLPERKPFSEFVSWHQEWMKAHQASAESYWRNLYCDDEIDSILSIKRTSASSHGIQKRIKLEIGDAAAVSLHRLAEESSLTVHAIVQGTWALLLCRYYRSRSVTFATIRSGRDGTLEGADGMIGMLVNFLPVHVRISGDSSAIDLFKAISEQESTAGAYQLTPLEVIRNAIPVAASTQLFDSCVLHESGSVAQELTDRFGRNGERTFALREDSNLPLLLVVREKPQFQIELIYQSGLFEEEEVGQLGRSFLALFRHALATPNAPVRYLELLEADDKSALIKRLTGPESSVPEDKALHHWFEEQVKRSPRELAVIAESSLTYEQLDQRANELARRLMANGAAPDQLVAIYLPRSANCLIAILGVLKSGAAYLPIDIELPQSRVKGILEDARLGAVVTETAWVRALPHLSVPMVLLDEATDGNQLSSDQPLPEVRGSQLAYVIPTSGTTGRSKLIGVEHRQTANLLTYATQSLLRPDDVRCVPFIDSPSFDSSISQIFTTLALGGTLVLVRDVLSIRSSAYYEKFTCLGSTPSLLSTIINETGLPPAVQLIGLGAEAIPTDLLEKLDDLPQVRKVINYYGPSETTVYCTVAIALDRSIPDGGVDLRNRGRIIGRPIANTRVYLVDEFGQMVPPGAPGEIYIAGAPVARGYLNPAGEAAANFRLDPFNEKPDDRLYCSGDVACMGTDGQLEFHGRKDNQLKINGVRIEAAEIENVLLNVPEIRQAVVDVRSGADGKKRLVAYLAADENFSSQNLRKTLRLLLPGSMVPHHFVILDSMPVTSNGKVDREALSRTDLGVEISSESDSDATPTETHMKEIWERNLARSSMGLEQDYFEMGGDSLSAVNLMLAIEQKFGIKLPAQILLERSTISDLAQLVDGGGSAPKPPKPASPASFVFLQESGDGVPLIIIPGGAGVSFLNYKNFAVKFLPDHPVYAMQSIYALMLEKPVDPVKYISNYVAEQVMSVVKDRPFVLFGHCIGGLLAWHVACILKKKNAPPFELVVYDAPAAQEGINITTSLEESASQSRLQKFIQAYRPAWEEWFMENGNSLRSKLGFGRLMLNNFLVRRGLIRSEDGQVRFAKLSYYKLLQATPLDIYPDDALLIYHRSQSEIVSDSLWPSLCGGKIEYQFIPGDHSNWQHAILNIVPSVRKKFQSIEARQEAVR